MGLSVFLGDFCDQKGKKHITVPRTPWQPVCGAKKIVKHCPLVIIVEQVCGREMRIEQAGKPRVGQH